MRRLLLAAACLAALAAAPPPRHPPRDVARAMLKSLASGDPEAAAERFGPAVRKALPPDTLRLVWFGQLARHGAYHSVTSERVETADAYRRVVLRARFAKSLVDVVVVCDRDGLVQGLFFAFVRSLTPPDGPDYARGGTFHDRDVRIGDGEGALPGTLSMPRARGPVPAVLIVQGSGPQDRDGSLADNKPYRDLAWGLATRGVAVLRFDKRAFAHRGNPKLLAPLLKDVTPKTEVLDDALAALALLRKTPGIDPARVYVAGHSLGGALAPRLARLDGRLAGLVVLAGPTRPLEDLVVEQVEYLHSLSDSPSAEARAELAKIRRQAARVKDPKLTRDVPPTELLFGTPASYWLALREYDAAATAAREKVPMLVVQGGRDYQVTDKDFDGWKKALAGRKDVTFRRYDGLNHLMMAGKGKPTPAEYERAGHVDRGLVEDVAAWVRAGR